MKEIKEKRFTGKNPEEISFKGEPISDPPNSEVKPVKDDRTSVRSSERDEAIESTTLNDTNSYVIKTPANRRKTRHPFDIFEDQVVALKKIQMAESDQEDNRRQTLGEMAQEALDLLIRERAKKLPNIALKRD